ncbi:MAG: CDGSH iron-sulfur domain-containing protein [Bacteroidota bacterium]
MDKPVVFDTKPVGVELEAGKNYAWCSCGQSATQPFCDGSHKPITLRPVVFQVEETKTYYMCNCKHSAMPQFCDGSHKELK